MKPTANKRFMMHLASIQRVGPLVIVGGLRTSRTDTLCTHANILLVHLKLDKSCHRAAVRMTTLLHSHPVTKFYHRAAKHRVKHHKSPLHQLTLAFDTVHEDYETIMVAGCNPALMSKWPFKTEIPASKEDSKDADVREPEHIKIYSDGSVHDRMVGVLAIMTKNGKTMETLHYYLGQVNDHRVFEVELVGILMELHMIETYLKANTTFAIVIDKQVAIKALLSKFNKPGHYLAVEAFRTATKI